MSKEKRKKHPKLMIFSTILMVALLVISISTATFAWFTANSIVTIDTLTFTAEHSGESEISISWNQYMGGAVPGNQISLDTSHDLRPCIPSALPVANTTEFGTFRTTFTGATIGMPKGGSDPDVKVFNENGEPEQPFISTNPNNDTQHHFFVTNHGNSAVNLIVYFQAVTDLDGDGEPDQGANNENIGLLRMSLFVGDTPNSVKYHSTVVAFGSDDAVAATPKTHYGSIVKDADPTDFNEITTTTATIPIALTANGGYKVFALVFWYDGVYLDELRSGLDANVEVVFQG